jgi:hypothetical protein
VHRDPVHCEDRRIGSAEREQRQQREVTRQARTCAQPHARGERRAAAGAGDRWSRKTGLGRDTAGAEHEGCVFSEPAGDLHLAIMLTVRRSGCLRA